MFKSKASHLPYRIVNVAVAVFLLLFVFYNINAFYSTGEIGYLLVTINETVYVALYLVREQAVATSSSAYDWTVALLAIFVGTLLRPGYPLNISLGDTLIIIGTMITIVSVLYLNRSISIVPAERRIKTMGPYRVIRHPMYSGEILGLFGYLLANVSLLNILIVTGNTVLLLIRLNREELFLSRNEPYRKYTEKTSWKLLPFVY